jgi:RNA polymerase sigma-70 factor (ECF subfamily)
MGMSGFGETLEQDIPRLRRYALALTRDRVAAADLVQSTLARARQASSLATRLDLRHWLFPILHNQRVSELRSPVREERALAGDGRFAWITAATPKSDGEISLRELGRAIAALREARRRVVLLIGLQGVSYTEAAAILGLPVGTIRSRLARARKSLRKKFHIEAVAEPVSVEREASSERLAA